jgi:hypothetical protein
MALLLSYKNAALSSSRTPLFSQHGGVPEIVARLWAIGGRLFHFSAFLSASAQYRLNGGLP